MAQNPPLSTASLEEDPLANIAPSLESPPRAESPTVSENKIELSLETKNVSKNSDSEGAAQIFNQNIKHVELIEKLKLQLKELERYAYQTGQLQCLPSSDLLERQAVIINQFKSKLSLNFDELDRLGPDDLKRKVDEELTELINPIIMKEHLVDQLKTQITDLERYIAFLHGVDDKIDIRKVCSCLMHGQCISKYMTTKAGNINEAALGSHEYFKGLNLGEKSISPLLERLKFSIQETINVADQSPDRNVNVDTKAGTDSNLPLDNSQEKDVNENNVIQDGKSPETSEATDQLILCQSVAKPIIGTPNMVAISQRFIFVVRKHLASSLRDLLGYGLIDDSSNGGSFFDPYYLLSSLTCLPGSKMKDTSSQSKPHVWNVIEKYYQTRNTQFNASSAKTLSQSFNLSSIGTLKMSSKQTLLLAVDDIIAKLSKLRRGPDSHFKALVCAGLNQSKLAIWLRLIFKNKCVIKRYYHSWSFVQSDLFDSILIEIDRLSHLKCNLPIEGNLSKLESAF